MPKANAIVSAVAIAVLAIATYVFFAGDASTPPKAQTDLGTYHYQCDGFTFAMVPATDVSSVTIVPAPGAPFFRTVLSAAGTGRFEGGGVELIGSGEMVRIANENGAFECSPLPSSERAPWNWGDTGLRTRNDLAAITTESIIGIWRSDEDPRFARLFEADGTAADFYDDEPSARGTWAVFTDASAISAPFPVEANAAYLRMIMSDAGEEMQYYRVIALTPETLELVTVGRDGALRFTRVIRAAEAALVLSGKGLTSVPQDVFSRRELVRLDLSDNALTGALPAEVRHLSKLEELDLSGNDFTGVPAEVGQLSRLRRLDLSGNPITGLPYELGNLSALRELDLRGTSYSKTDLDIIRVKIPQATILTD